jgi:hypothetical protein
VLYARYLYRCAGAANSCGKGTVPDHAAVVDAVVDYTHLSKLMHHKHSCAAGHALLEVALLRVAGDTLVVLPVLERLA